MVDVTVTKKTDGTFVEAQLDSHNNDDLSPLGITANNGKGQGTFFYAVGSASLHPTADRVGFVRLPMAEKARHARDDDDSEDGWDHQSHPSGWHENDADDDDDDGLENEYDSPTAQENVQLVDVYSPMGLLVATSVPAPGLAVAPVMLPGAGNYKVRIRNYGVLPITPTPKLIVREPWLP